MVLGRPLRAAVSTLACLALADCGAVSTVKDSVIGGPTLGVPGVSGFIGGVAADEPRAVLIGKQVLGDGGSAEDAAAAVGFALSVTLPSRAGLGGGGACLVYAPGHGAPRAVLFTSAAPAVRSGDRPAAVPMLAQGLAAVHARGGVLPIERSIAPAEQLATFGTPVSRALAADLDVVGGALVADPVSMRVFGRGGVELGEGDLLVQTDLGATLARLRVGGSGEMVSGQLAQALVAGSAAAGGAIGADDLAAALPHEAAALVLPAGADRVAFLPPPADGGLAAGVAFRRLQRAPDDVEAAQALALGAASAWRGGRQDAAGILEETDAEESTIGALPASTSFVTLDRTGGAVACALSMGNLFGTGRVAAATGVLLAASPAAAPAPLLAAAIAWNDAKHAFRAEVAGSGQAGASLGVALGMTKTLRAKSAMPSTVPDPGRINAIACPRDLPGDGDQCAWATDPRGAGAAAGTN